ncbi:hypothetical protein CTAYLR_008536 [Chrysophaeum taylorii]|uniref:JmjC domain-containing protein n=1 Tax=Chrysophaeum taylorii TaxID=2483200 RepID=A0AAD7U830_9STRA|nr:hypothetical protein CTAYLR_008536 [Chrysophaeum taylorii]
MLVERHGTQPAWSVDTLRDDLGDVMMRVSDKHGAMVGVRDYLDYAGTTADDAPLSLYDSQFKDDVSPLERLEYDRPGFASAACYLSALRLAPDQRPPWRWILLGGPRSGTGPHVDPLCSHAWVHLFEGRKLWLLLPPGTLIDYRDHEPAATFFWRRRDDIKRRFPYIEFVQRPGELVYVPAGWIHAVLNLDTALAVTENWISLDDDDKTDFLADEPALLAKIERSRRVANAVLNDEATVTRLLNYLPTPDVVAISPTCRAFERAALCSPYFWHHRLYLDFGPMPNAAASRLSHTLAKRNSDHARSCRSLYLNLHEAAQYERLAIHQGLC